VTPCRLEMIGALI